MHVDIGVRFGDFWVLARLLFLLFMKEEKEKGDVEREGPLGMEKKMGLRTLSRCFSFFSFDAN